MTDHAFDFEGPADADADDSALLNKRQLSELSGLPVKRIEAFVRAGLPSIPGATTRAPIRFDVRAVFDWFANGQGAAPDPFLAARQRKAEAEAEALEFKNRKAAGDLVSLREVRRDLAEGLAQLRGHMLAIPARMTGQSDQVRAEIKTAIVEGLNAFSIPAVGADDATS